MRRSLCEIDPSWLVGGLQVFMLSTHPLRTPGCKNFASQLTKGLMAARRAATEAAAATTATATATAATATTTAAAATEATAAKEARQIKHSVISMLVQKD